VERHTAAGLNQYNRQRLWEVDIHYFILELYSFSYRLRRREKKTGSKEGRHIGSPCLIKFMKYCIKTETDVLPKLLRIGTENPKYSNIFYAGIIFEKTEINNLFALNLCQHVMAMSTYERTNCVNWCLPTMHKKRQEPTNRILRIVSSVRQKVR
jgi:hypothetical protein